MSTISYTLNHGRSILTGIGGGGGGGTELSKRYFQIGIILFLITSSTTTTTIEAIVATDDVSISIRGEFILIALGVNDRRRGIRQFEKAILYGSRGVVGSIVVGVVAYHVCCVCHYMYAAHQGVVVCLILILCFVICDYVSIIIISPDKCN